LEWDGDPNQIPTKDKRYIRIDTTARWKIIDPLKFFESVYNETGAHARLDDIIDAAVRDAVTSHNLVEIVRSSNRIIENFEKIKILYIFIIFKNHYLVFYQ
jgi:membrane protease subunit HflC